MTRTTWVSGLGSEYDTFLFAPVTTDGNGTLLSVISALARLNLDPWQEAARLARLPGEAAIERLASLIAAMPDKPPVTTEPDKVAARLVALLPRRTASGVPPGQALRRFRAVTKSQAVVYAILVLAALLLGAQWFAATRPSHAPAGFEHTSAWGTTKADTRVVGL